MNLIWLLIVFIIVSLTQSYWNRNQPLLKEYMMTPSQPGVALNKFLGLCPINETTIGCPPNTFVCLSGIAQSGCNNNAHFWENTSACLGYCQKYDYPQPISPPSRQPAIISQPFPQSLPIIPQSLPPNPIPISESSPVVQNGSFRNITVTNQMGIMLWIGTYGQNYIPANGGFALGPDKSHSFIVPSNWTSGRIWARTGCFGNQQSNQLICESGDCDGKFYCSVTGTPPASLAEFTLSDKGSDYYDISLVDGYNVPISIRPVEGTYSPVSNPGLGKFNCGFPQCKKFNMDKCPEELKMKGRMGTYCASICTAVNNITKVNDPSHIASFNKSLVCCDCACGANCGCSNPRCKYGCSPLDEDPDRLGGRCYIEDWPLSSTGQSYGAIFKNQCPDAYSWQFDDASSTYQCSLGDYEVIFG